MTNIVEKLVSICRVIKVSEIWATAAETFEVVTSISVDATDESFIVPKGTRVRLLLEKHTVRVVYKTESDGTLHAAYPSPAWPLDEILCDVDCVIRVNKD